MECASRTLKEGGIMATRSRIAYSDGGDVVHSYHHWDGYPEGLGRHLVKHFPTWADAKRLVDGGDMSTCMGSDTEDGVVNYHRDRNEPWENTKPENEYIQDYMSIIDDRLSPERENPEGLEYLYAHVKGEWQVTDDGIDFEPIEEYISRMKRKQVA